MKKFKEQLFLFLTMLKIGCFTFGGGLAMLTLLENEFVSKKGYLSKEEFLDMVAIAESTPGPVAVNSATYIGYRAGGFWGSLAATVGVCIPSFVIIFLISLFFDAFLSLTWVAYAFQGIRVGVIYLILSGGYKLFSGIEPTPLNVILTLSVFALMVVLSLLAVSFSSILLILGGGIFGVTLYLIRRLSEKRRGEQ